MEVQEQFWGNHKVLCGNQLQLIYFTQWQLRLRSSHLAAPMRRTDKKALLREAREHAARLRQLAEQTRAEADERLTQELIAEYGASSNRSRRRRRFGSRSCRKFGSGFNEAGRPEGQTLRVDGIGISRPHTQLGSLDMQGQQRGAVTQSNLPAASDRGALQLCESAS